MEEQQNNPQQEAHHNYHGQDPNARRPTGIPGFDNLIAGGFVPRSVNLVCGGSGCGKSIFCMQFLWNGASIFHEPGLFISFEEGIEDLRKDGAAFGWDFDSLEEHRKVHFVYFHPYDVMDVHKQIEELINQTGAKRVVFDSTSVYGMTLESKYEVRKALYELTEMLKKKDCVSLITAEVVESGKDGSRYSRFGVEEFLSDSIISISFESLGGQFPRSLQVRKMRRTKNDEDVHPMQITPDGIVVHNL